jgi:hypothetical protein
MTAREATEVPRKAAPYERAWESLRWRAWALAITMALPLPMAALAAQLALSQGRDPSSAAVVVIFVLLPFPLGTAFALAAWRCPRCGHDFLEGPRGWHPLLRSACLVCGLPRWCSDEPPAPQTHDTRRNAE